MNVFKKFPPAKSNARVPTVIDVKLSTLLGIDTSNSSSLTINIIDDLPTNINFNHTVGISTSKNFFLAALNKLFINPKSLKDQSKVSFKDFENHVKEIEKQLAIVAQEPTPPCKCCASTKKKKYKRVSFIKEKANACSC